MTTEKAVTATVHLGDRVLTDVPVLNPGGWFGKTWLLEIGGSYSSLYVVVEAGSVDDAIDELADDATYGHHIAIPESDFADYGTRDGDAWTRLDGVVVTDPEQGRYLSEPYYGGNAGTPCDLDHLAVHGDDRQGFTAVTYDVPGYPVLVKPTDLEKIQAEMEDEANANHCDHCGAQLETCCDGVERCLECNPCPACDDGGMDDSGDEPGDD